ncbi:amidinotransferase [Niastella caeni]|uniref:Amidinotransferase n=1 Tax=Niastella caeni TaxID=2569763 RepID=A0A4V4H0A7_9BACT|nr:arginine deiminase-related protein [Niastella caeni]THU35886.1 amidinotransferase [Niastella caeni]
MQTTSHILMIRPVNFGFNAQTAVNNAFQVAGSGIAAQEKAELEFDNFVTVLRSNGVDVTVIDDTPEPHTPDSVFPNNWISFHDHNTICLYPMFAENRRQERKPGVIQQIQQTFTITNTFDFTSYENDQLFLEGTGSMVLDRDHKIAYACLSPRTHQKVLDDFCRTMNYRPVLFTAVDSAGKAIYHTNVMMCVADRYVVICLESLPNHAEYKMVQENIGKSGKELINISFEQMNHFAGNMLQVENNAGEKLLVMSSQAFKSLKPEQVKKLESYNRILHAPLTTIETNGGGSARCMMAEIFLKKKIANH